MKYDVTDPLTGRKLTLTGDSLPTEQELNEIFTEVYKVHGGGPKRDVFDEVEREYQQSQAQPSRNVFDEVEAEALRSAPMPEPTGLKAVARTVAPYARPVLEYGGALAGGLVGGTGGALGLNPASVAAGAAIGSGLGYAGGRHAANALEEYAELREPPTLRNALVQTGEDIGTGAAMEMTGQVAGPMLNILLKPVPKAGRALYEQVMKITPSTPTKERETIIRTGLEGGYNATKRSLKKLEHNLDVVNNEISSAIDGMTQTQTKTRTISGQTRTSNILDMKGQPFQTATAPRQVTENVGTIDMNEVVKRVDDLKSFYNRLGPEAAADFVKPLEDIQAKYAARGFVTPKEAQAMKQTLYALNRKHYGELSNTVAEGNKAIARGLKEELVRQYPELGKLNARDSELIQLEQALERAVNRIGNKELITYGDLIAGGLGAAGGYAMPGDDLTGTATGVIFAPLLFKMMKVPSIQGRVGILLNRARNIGKQGALKYKAPAYLMREGGSILERQDNDERTLREIIGTGNNGDL